MKFSERIGKSQVKTSIQLDSIDEDLRNSLYNAVYVCLLEHLNSVTYVEFSKLHETINAIWISFLKLPIDTIPSRTTKFIFNFRQTFFEWDYLEVYDFIDFLASKEAKYPYSDLFVSICNSVLEKELSGYRYRYAIDSNYKPK